MSAHTCSASSSLFESGAKPSQQVFASPAAPAPVAVVADAPHKPRAMGGLLGKLVAAVRQWRMKARMRNQAADMDPHIMQDIGVPDWLVNETTLHRELSRMRDADYIRW